MTTFNTRLAKFQFGKIKDLIQSGIDEDCN